MELLIFWLTTIVVSFGMHSATALKMVKDLADNGYKINFKNIESYTEQMQQADISKTHLLQMLIPIVNIMQSMELTVTYNNMRPFIIDQLRVLDSLDEMSQQEFEEYKKKPTGLNALNLSQGKTRFTSVEIDNGKSKIYFKFGDNTKDIIILKTIGPANNLSDDELKIKVQDALDKLSMGELIKTVIKNDAETIDLDSLSEEDNTTNSLSPREKIEELEKTKEELLAPQNDQGKVHNKSLNINKK